MNLKLASLPWSAVQWQVIQRSLRSLPPLLNLWKRPLLLAAIGLHALILILPTPDQSTQEKPAPKEVIKVSQLAAAPPKPAKPKSAKPKSAKPKSTKPKPAKPKSAKPKRSTPAVATRPKPKADQPDKPDKTDKPDKPDQPDPSPTPDPSPAPPVNSTGGDGTGSGKGLVDELSKAVLAKLLESGTNDEVTLQEFMASVPETIPERVYGNFVGDDGQILVDRGAFASLAIPQMSASAAFADYIEPILSQQLGFTVEAIEPSYGEASLYEAKNAGGVSFFFSLVKLTNSSGAFMVLWKTDPRTT